MADTEERARKRAERRLKRKEKEKLAEGSNIQDIHMNGADPDISREAAQGLQLKSEASLPDVVKVPSGLNENWQRPVTPEIDDEGFSRGMNGYKSYSHAVAANAEKSSLQKRKDQYANTALSGRRYDSDEDAEFEPEVRTSESHNVPPVRKVSGSSAKDDEWSQLETQKTAQGGSEFYTEDELNQMDKQSQSSDERNRKVSEEWRTAMRTSQVRGVNKPKSYLKKSDSWIRERPELPEEPTLKEPPWLDLVRKRRWRSTVKARFPQTERERIQFERRLDTSKKGLKFNPRGEPTGITGPEMDDELSLYLIQQRRRIQSDDVIDSGFPSVNRSSVSSANLSSVFSESESAFQADNEYHDDDPKNRELAAEKGILNLSRPPIKGPKKEVHKNLAMERSRASTMKWRFSIDPHEAPLWTHLPKPSDIEALNDLDVGLEAKYWSSRKKFQTGQFDPPKVLPKPRSRSSSGLSRSHSSSEVDFARRSSHASTPKEDMTPLPSRSSVKEMKQKLASGEFLTSTPLPVKPVELEQGYLPRLRDLQQKLADRAENEKPRNMKPKYISPEELASMGEKKKSITEELFTEKDETPKPIERPRKTRSRSDAELLDLLKSRKDEADQSTVETAQEISSLASDISKTFGEEGKDVVKTSGNEKGPETEQQKLIETAEQGTKVATNQQKVGEKKKEQVKKEVVEGSHRATCPEFLVKLKDCEVLEGKDISLEIVVSGEPRPTVQWFLDERLLTSKDKRHVTISQGSVHSLNINNIQIEDEGIYECVATNVAGTAKCDCEVLVND